MIGVYRYARGVVERGRFGNRFELIDGQRISNGVATNVGAGTVYDVDQYSEGNVRPIEELLVRR
jgi:hypothetical protein